MNEYKQILDIDTYLEQEKNRTLFQNKTKYIDKLLEIKTIPMKRIN